MSYLASSVLCRKKDSSNASCTSALQTALKCCSASEGTDRWWAHRDSTRSIELEDLETILRIVK